MRNPTDFMHELCDLAARETLPRFRSSLEIDNKEEVGFDPVTEGDRAAERVIRAHIEKNFPDHGILGEEYAARNPKAEYLWIVDPIDGTRAFVSGLPVWGTLIGLYKNGVPYAGIMDQPFTGERYFADKAGARYRRVGGEPDCSLKTRSTANLQDAIMMTTSPYLFTENGEESKAYSKLESRVRLPRYGCDCYAYCMVAAGHIDLVVESGLHIYDIAALIPVIEKAGGKVTAWDGGDASQGGQILAAANEDVHLQAMEILRHATA